MSDIVSDIVINIAVCIIALIGGCCVGFKEGFDKGYAESERDELMRKLEVLTDYFIKRRNDESGNTL